MFTIYLIVNNATGKTYIGRTCRGLRNRWLEHLCRARKGSIFHIHSAIRKYGADKFSLQILGTALDIDEANNLERVWICVLQSSNPQYGYNETIGGEGYKLGHVSWAKGKKFTPEHRARLSEAARHRIHNERTAREMGHRNLGRKHSLATREKMGNARRGSRRSKETKIKMAAARRLWWQRRKAVGIGS